MITRPTSEEAVRSFVSAIFRPVIHGLVWSSDGRRIPMVALDGGCGGTALFRRKSHGVVCSLHLFCFLCVGATSKIPLVSLML